MVEKKNEDWATWIESVILDFIEHSPKNTLQNQAQDKAFENPLVGFSRGDDPIFETFKEHVGLFHWTPPEIFSLTFPETPFRLHLRHDDCTINWKSAPQIQARLSANHTVS